MPRKKKSKAVPLAVGKICSVCHRRMKIGETYLHMEALSHTEDGPREFIEAGKVLIHMHHYACSPACARQEVEYLVERYLKEANA